MDSERSVRFQMVLAHLQTQYDEVLRELEDLGHHGHDVRPASLTSELAGLERWQLASPEVEADRSPERSLRSLGSKLHFRSLQSHEWFGMLVGQVDQIKDQIKTSKKSSLCEDELYRKLGYPAAIVTSRWFRFTTLTVIVLNAVWIAVDMDLKLGEDRVVAAYHSLQSIFCSFFLIEAITRFMAFENRWAACKEMWYAFDCFLVIAMIVETVVLPWIAAVIMSRGQERYDEAAAGTQLLWISRFSSACRCVQVGRVGKFVRLVPETKTLMTCVVIGLRGVSAACVIVVAFTYGFAVLLRIMSEGSNAGHEYFSTFLHAALTLLILAVVPESHHFLLEVADAPWYFLLALAVFLLIIQLTIMNLLIGLLCKVVENVSEAEKEATEASFLTETMAEVVAEVDSDRNGRVSKAEMLAILGNPKAIDSLRYVGIDVVALVDSIDEIFEVAGVREFDIEHFVEALQQFRASTNATVAVITDLRKCIFRRVAALEKTVISAYEGQIARFTNDKSGKCALDNLVTNSPSNRRNASPNKDNARWPKVETERLEKCGQVLHVM